MTGMTNGGAVTLRPTGGTTGWAGAGLAGPLADAQTRRQMLAVLGWSTMALLALQALVAFVAYFWPRRTSWTPGRITAGRPDEYQVGDVRQFVDGRFYLSRVEEGFVALRQKCPHLGCTVQWMPARIESLKSGEVLHGVFRCPCHGSTYRRNGDVVIGPAPRPMDILPVRLENGQLTVDAGKPSTRARWEPSQALAI